MQKLYKILILIVYIVSISIIRNNTYSNNLLQVYCLDIGQGDSILIKSPDNKMILIDGGPDNTILYELGEVLPYWVTKIDIVILTHPDLDHLGGLIDIGMRYKVDTYIFHSEIYHSAYFQYFKQLIVSYGMQALDTYKGDLITLGKYVEFEILWPIDAYFKNNDNVNDGSIAGILSYGNFSMYLGGDLSIKYELLSVKKNNFDVDVLKLGHHGSKFSTSDKFIKQIDPEVAIAIVGENNRFGHPNDEVITILDDNLVELYRTDQQGRIVVNSNGHGYWIDTER